MTLRAGQLATTAATGSKSASDDDAWQGLLPSLVHVATQDGLYRVAITGFQDEAFDGSEHEESFDYELAISVTTAPPSFPEQDDPGNGTPAGEARFLEALGRRQDEIRRDLVTLKEDLEQRAGQLPDRYRTLRLTAQQFRSRDRMRRRVHELGSKGHVYAQIIPIAPLHHLFIGRIIPGLVATEGLSIRQ